MACTYKYKGKTYTDRALLTNAVAQDIANKKINSKSADTRQVFEVNGNLGRAAAQVESNILFGDNEFINFVDVQDKTYMVVDDRMMDDELGPIKTVYTAEGKAVQVDIEKEFAKYKEGRPIKQLAGVKAHVLKKTAQELYEMSVEDFNNANKESDVNLFNKLKAFSEKIGVSVIKLDSYIQNYEQRFGTPATVKGVADMMNSVIALSNDANVGDFVEEVAHFAIEYYTDREIVQKMMESVDQTEAYQREAAIYRNRYSKQASGEQLENKVRKEILGKILAEKIADNFEDTSTGINEKSIFDNLRELFQDFVNLFRISDSNREFFQQFGQILDQMSSDIVQGQVLQNFAPYQSNEFYFSLSESEQSVVDSLQELKRVAADRYRRLSKDSRMERGERRIALDIASAQITEAHYAEALMGFARLNEIDLKNARTSLIRAKNDVDRQINQSRALDPNYIPPSSNERLEMITDALGKVDLNNLIVYLNNIDAVITQIKGNLDLMRTQEIISASAVSTIENIVRSVEGIKNEVQGEYNDIATTMAAKEVRQQMERAGYDRKTIGDYMARIFSKRFMKDIYSFTANVFNLGAHGNPISSTIYHLITKANADKDLKVLSLAQRTREQSARLRIGSAQELLIDEGYMIENIHRRSAETDYKKEVQAVRDKYVEQISKLDRNDPAQYQQIVELESKSDEEVRKVNESWLEQRFNGTYESRLNTGSQVNPITNTRNRTREAKKYIRDFSVERSKVFAPLTDPVTGRVDVSALSRRSVERLQSIKSSRERAMSLYNEDGTIKDERNLAIAYDLLDYYRGGDDIQISEEAVDLFDLERSRAKRKMSAADFALWEQTFSYESLDDEFLPGNQPLFLVNEELTAENIDVNLFEDMLEQVYVPGLKPGETPTLQQVYEGFLQKRRSLLSPYRVVGKSGEINGEIVEKDSNLMNAIYEVDHFLSFFRVDQNVESNVTLEKVPNESFKRMYNKMKEGPRAEFASWKRLNTVPGRVDTQGFPMPSQRHYYKWAMFNSETGGKLQVKKSPTFFWQMKFEQEREVNPNFRPEMQGKALQFNRTRMQEYKNRKYFDLFGIDENDPFSNKPTRNKNLWEFRQFFLDEKEAMDRPISHLSNTYYVLPQVYKYDNEMFKDLAIGVPGEGKRRGAAKAWFESTFKITEQDDEFNKEAIDANKKISHVETDLGRIPTHFTRLVDDPSKLTTDLGYMLGKYGQMSYNYQEKSKILPQIATLRDTMALSTFKGKTGTQSNSLKAVDEFITTHVYGNKYVDLGTIFGSNISATKTINSLYDFMRNKNLGLNTYVPLTSYGSALLQKRALASENIYLSDESLNWAAVASNFNAGLLFNTDMQSLDPKMEFKKLLEFTGNTMFNEDYFKQVMATSRIERGAATVNPLYDVAGYKFFSKLTGVNTMYAVLDNYRLYNGNFVSKARFEEMKKNQDSKISKGEINREWATLRNKSYYNYLDTSGKKIAIKQDKARRDGFKGDFNALTTNMNENVRKATELVEGATSETDRGLVARNPLIKLVAFLHKGYFQRFLETRFRGKTLNISAGVEEEGTYSSFSNVFKRNYDTRGLLSAMMGAISFMSSAGFYQQGMAAAGLSEMERRNLNRMRRDVQVYLASLAAFILLNAAADDDDDPLVNYLAYISSRVFLETSSVQLPSGFSEIYKVFQSPSAGISIFKDFTGLPVDLFSTLIFDDESQEITRGTYKGLKKGTASFIKLTPFKNVYSLMYGDMGQSNTYFRTKAIGDFPNWLVEEAAD